MGRDDRLTFNPSGQVKALRFSSIASGWWDGLEESHNTFRDVIIPGFKIQQVTRASIYHYGICQEECKPSTRQMEQVPRDIRDLHTSLAGKEKLLWKTSLTLSAQIPNSRLTLR